MKKKLTQEERDRLVDLIESAGEENKFIIDIAKLAIQMSDKGEYYKFQEVFSEEKPFN